MDKSQEKAVKFQTKAVKFPAKTSKFLAEMMKFQAKTSSITRWNEEMSSKNSQIPTKTAKFLAKKSHLATKYFCMSQNNPLCKDPELMRQRCHAAFLKNKTITDPQQVEKLISHGKYIEKELQALYMLKKYRTLKRRYYDNDNELLAQKLGSLEKYMKDSSV